MKIIIKNASITKFEILCLAILVPSVCPMYLLIKWPILDQIMDGWKLGALLCVLLFFVNKKGIRFHPVTIYFGIYWIVLLLITFINQGDLRACVALAITVMENVLLFDYIISAQKYRVINLYLLILKMLIWINLVSILIFPNGMYETRSYDGSWVENSCWFLGYKNNYIGIIFLAILMSVYLAILKTGNVDKKSILLIVVCFVETLLVDSATSTVALLLLLILILIKPVKRIINKINVYVIVLVQMGAFILLVFFEIHNMFEKLIVNILGRSMTLSGRTFVWARAVELIKENWFLGFGVQNTILVRKMLTKSWAGNCHNQYLEFFFLGGVILFVIWTFILCLAAKNILHNNDKLISLIFKILLFAVMTIMQVEVLFSSNSMTPFWYVLYIMCRSDVYIKNAYLKETVYEY